MKSILALIAICLTGCTVAHAEDMPKQFEYQYTPEVQIVLLPDVCDKSDASKGWQAYAKSTNGDKAIGCWMHKDNTVLIWVEVKPHEYIDFEFYKDKFKPVY